MTFRGYGGGLPMKTIWYTVIILVSICAFLLIPFSIFYYESDEEKANKDRAKSALCYTLCSAIFIGVAIAILYTLFSKAEIPVLACQRGISSRTSSTEPLSAAVPLA